MLNKDEFVRRVLDDQQQGVKAGRSCPRCDGRGVLLPLGLKCGLCDGTGRVTAEQEESWKLWNSAFGLKRDNGKEGTAKADDGKPRLPEGVQADTGQILEELRRIRGLLEIIVQEVAKQSYTHF